MLRMQILTDILRGLLKKKLIDEDQYYRVHVDGNAAINEERDDPFSYVVAQLLGFGLTREDIDKEFEIAVATSDVISYLHVGRPETILVDDAGRVAS
ncbi:hypothetical protein [Devosia sp.]|jgi:hypothetical protein|uniref:hypothetical protein n=1 Tax=Devosia sp. TaxID=1871048 RepID=UPI0037C047A5